VKGYFKVIFPNTRGNYIGMNAKLEDINLGSVLELIDRVIQSAGVLEYRDIEFQYIFSPNSFRLGSSPDISYSIPKLYGSQPAGVDKYNFEHNPTWKVWTHYGENVCCAAVCLFYHLNKTNPYCVYNLKSKAAEAWFAQGSMELQNELDWQSDVSMDSFQDFVDKYPSYKVAIFMNHVKRKPVAVYIGSEYVDATNHTNTKTPENCIPIFLDDRKGVGHFAYIRSMAKYFTGNGIGDPAFCWKCTSTYPRRGDHSCIPNNKRRKVACKHCGSLEHSNKHCIMQVCKICKHQKPRDATAACLHRCIVPKELPAFKEYLRPNDIPDGSKIGLFCWDIESMFKEKEYRIDHVREFERDEENRFTGHAESSKTITCHIPNLVVCKNVFLNDEEKVFFGPNCIEDFLQYIKTFNAGNNIAIAHNSGRYDSRLLLSAICRQDNAVDPELITRGTNILCLDVPTFEKDRKVRFIDSFNFMPQSLASLAYELGFSSKGTFPIYFNTVYNQEYVGNIPDLSYYIIPRSTKEFEDLKEWYAAEKEKNEQWSLKEKLIEYCRQDVDILCKVVESFDTSCRSMCPEFQISPWQFITGPAFVHKCVMTYAYRDIEDKFEQSNIDKSDKLAVGEYFSEVAHKEAWACLLPAEYHFARKALRGGRTDLKAVYYKLTEDDIAAGRSIRYVDIVSSYPSQQLKHLYPTGTPVVHVYDENFYPSNDNATTLDNSTSKLKHEGIRVIECNEQPTKEMIMADESFFGIVCVTLHIPTDCFDPAIPVYNEKELKCTFPCGLIEKVYITTPELKAALEDGAEIIKLHRFDKYKADTPPWRDFIWKCYLGKMKNSKNPPSLEEQKRLTHAYETAFGYSDLEFDKWAKNPAMKKVSKVLVNCAWGKHAQNMFNDTCKLMSISEQSTMDYLADRIESAGRNEIGLDIRRVGSDRLLVGSKPLVNNNNKNVYSDGYLPAAVFVTAYGRLELYKYLRKLAPTKRTLYYDTDSIVYVHDPALWNPTLGDILGDMERDEEEESKGGIREWVCLAPKSYGFKYNNLETSVKCKGVTLSEWTKGLINFEKMVEMVHERLVHRKTVEAQIPQFQFKYQVGEDMDTYQFFKRIAFNEENCKGYVNPTDMKHYPPGYDLSLLE